MLQGYANNLVCLQIAHMHAWYIPCKNAKLSMVGDSCAPYNYMQCTGHGKKIV